MSTERLWVDGVEAWAEAHGYYKGQLPRVYSTGWSSLDETWKVRLGEMTVVSGVPNHGKSTWLDALMVNLAHLHGWKMAVFSPENHPLGVHAWHLIEKWAGQPMTKNSWGPGLTERDMEKAAEWMQDHFVFLSPIEQTVDGVLAAASAAFEAEPYQVMVIDPWNEVGDERPVGASETEWVSIALSRFRRWARERNVHLFLVVHPRKLERDKDGNYPVPNAYDLAGSAHWRNKADNIICYWRDLSSGTTEAFVYVQKVRFHFVGKVPVEPVAFVYDLNTRQYTGMKELNAGQRPNLAPMRAG